MSAINSITGRTLILCVIGHPIEHSMSLIVHNAAIRNLDLNYIYVSFNIVPKDLSNAEKALRRLEV